MERLEYAEVVVVAARHEVRLELGCQLEVGVADAVHALHPASVLPVDLAEPHDGGDAEEVHDREEHEGEDDEPGLELASPAPPSASATTEPVRAATKIAVRLIASV